MSKPEGSALVAAASDFDQELASYQRLGELFLRAPLNTVKHLERAKATLDELAGCEDRLQAAAQRLIGALGEARQRQESLAASVVGHAPALQGRNARLGELLAQMHSIAAEVAAINQNVTGSEPTDVPEVAARVLALSTRAETLSGEARNADFEELADQAHALEQRLRAIAKKLERR
jgi:HPt (histidine-containing phosphotransfer) domain-containing protein